MNDKTQFAKRLTRAMTDAGYPAKPAVLEREFNQRYFGRPVTLQAVCRWLRGEAMPTQDKLAVLADWLETDAQHLRYGTGMRTTGIRDKSGPWTVKGKVISPAEQEILEAFLALSAAQKKIVKEVIQAFTKTSKS